MPLPRLGYGVELLELQITVETLFVQMTTQLSEDPRADNVRRLTKQRVAESYENIVSKKTNIQIMFS